MLNSEEIIQSTQKATGNPSDLIYLENIAVNILVVKEEATTTARKLNLDEALLCSLVY